MSEPIFTTEAEAWDAIADTLEMTESMPPCEFGCCTDSGGLCVITGYMCSDGLIDYALWKAMGERITRAVAQTPSLYLGCYLASPGAWEPRIAIARQFAKEARQC